MDQYFLSGFLKVDHFFPSVSGSIFSWRVDQHFLDNRSQMRRITVSGSVSDGEVLVVRGPSGVGKTTLLRILARLQACNSGEAFLNNESWLKIPPTVWRGSVHYLAQKPALFDGTVASNLIKPFEVKQLSGKKFNTDIAKDTMKKLLLTPSIWEQDVRTLSGGEAARLTFTRALLLEPKVLMLDEPTAALDEKAREAFYEVLAEWLTIPGRAALLISHNNDYQELYRISFLNIEQQGDI